MTTQIKINDVTSRDIVSVDSNTPMIKPLYAGEYGNNPTTGISSDDAGWVDPSKTRLAVDDLCGSINYVAGYVYDSVTGVYWLSTLV